MDKNEIDLGRWVDERLSLLTLPDNCRLDTEHALGRLWNHGAAQSMRIPDVHLDRLLPENVEFPWFVGVWRNIRELVNPQKLPPLAVTSKPVPVKDIWGL